MESSTGRKTHAVLLPSLGLGHIKPFAEFARTLATDHSCKVTVLTFPWESNSRQQAILNNLISSPSALDIHLLPLTDLTMEDIISDKSLKIGKTISLIFDRAKPAVEAALRSLNETADAFIVDNFGIYMTDVVANLGIPCHLLYTGGMSLLLILLSYPKFASTNDANTSVCIDGVPPMQVEDLPEPLRDPASPAFETVLHRGRAYANLDGIFVNSFGDLEPKALETLILRKGEFLPESLPPIYPIGPVIAIGHNGSNKSCPCIDWLERQPAHSVLYVSFGSAATLSRAQITELALGLRESGQRFLWVLRRPTSEDSASTYVKEGDKEFEDLLPEGFLEQTKNRGMVVSSWVPQMSILGHESTGGFMYHGGWNSVLESVWCGVPAVVWPMFADQKVNKRVAEEIGCAVGVQMGKDGFVKRGGGKMCEGIDGRRCGHQGEGGGNSAHEEGTDVRGRWWRFVLCIDSRSVNVEPAHEALKTAHILMNIG